MPDVQPVDYASILRAGQGLVPDYADQQLRQQQEQQNQQLIQLRQQEQQAAISKQQAEAQRRQAYDDAVHDFIERPTPQAAAALQARFPEQAQAVKGAFEVQEKAAQEGDLRQLAAVHGYLTSGHPELAQKAVERRIEADKAAGVDTREDEELLDLIKTDPDHAKGITAFTLSSIVGPDKFAGALEQVNAGQSGFTLGPGSKRYDANGNVIAEAPFAPRAITVGDGDTVVEYQPGEGGGQASGGGGAPIQVASLVQSALPGANITSAKRTQAQQDALIASGATNARNSYHVRGEAVDVAPMPGTTFAQAKAKIGYLAAQQGGRLVEAIDESKSGGTGPHWHFAIEPLKGAGGPRVIAQGAPKPGYRLMTPQENVQRGLDPNVRYQTSPDGQITALGGQEKSQGQLKPTPQAPAKAILENTSTLREIDRAIGLLEKYPGAIGYGTGAIGDWFTQRNDPKGVPVRAALGKIGGKIIHDVSGAAVTLSEAPRFQPYVPAMTDTAETALQKLRQMRDLASADQADLASAWGPENGYRGVKLAGAAPAKPTTATHKGWSIQRVR